MSCTILAPIVVEKISLRIVRNQLVLAVAVEAVILRSTQTRAQLRAALCYMLRRPPSRIELKSEDKDEVSLDSPSPRSLARSFVRRSVFLPHVSFLRSLNCCAGTT